MKMYRDEKTGLQRLVLFVEIFANVFRSSTKQVSY